MEQTAQASGKSQHIKAHVADYKKEIVSKLAKLMKDYPIVAVVNMENLPAPQLQTMRGQLRKDCYITMTKRRLIKLAIDQAKSSKKGIEQLEAHLGGMPALIFTKENPFKLSRTLQRSKSPAPAKAGQTAPRDIIINKGPTPFAPGPIIGELAAAGIKSGVEGGKVAIKEDSVVAKAGEKIKPKVAEILLRLGVQPMEVGLDLVAVYENGLVYKRDILSIDEKEYMKRLSNAARWAFNLAIEAAYPAKDTITVLIGKANNDAKALGVSQNIFDKGIIELLVGKAEMQMMGLKETANIPDPELKSEETAEAKQEVKDETKPTEEKKEEKPAERKETAKPEEKKEKLEPKTEEKKAEPESKPEIIKEEPNAEIKKEQTSDLKQEKPAAEKKEYKPEAEKEKSHDVRAPTKEELEANMKMREKQKAEKEVEDIAKDIIRKAGQAKANKK